MKFYLQLAVLGVVGLVVYAKIAPRWRGWSEPLAPVEDDVGPSAAMPGERGAAPAGKGQPAPAPRPAAQLAMPKAPAGGSNVMQRAAAAASAQDSSQLVAGQDAPAGGDYMGNVQVGNQAAPTLFQKDGIAKESLANAKPEATYDARTQPAWLTKLKSIDQNFLLGAGALISLLLLGAIAKAMSGGGSPPPAPPAS